MKLAQVREVVEGLPYMSSADGKLIYEHILKSKPELCLELGFAHGVSSLYIAAALDELGHGELHAVDLLSERDRRRPSIEDLLQKSGLSGYVSVFREHTSYTWFLKKQIERQTQNHQCVPLYDFAFIDGPKNWTIDGMAFFCVDKLLRRNGWILFDDIEWYYGNYDKPVLDGITVRELSHEERMTPQIKALFELIVMQHPNYSNFILMDNGWGWAEKVASDKLVVRYDSKISLRYRFMKLARSMVSSKESRRSKATESSL
jgi:predicted O-methyltransferase YrrM